WINSAYGQNAFPQFPAVPSSNNTSGSEVTTKQQPPPTQTPSLAAAPPSSLPAEGAASKLSSSSSSSSIEHGVRIISPTRNQQVPAGATLTISGISKDNATSDCYVNVNVNHVRPYQNTSATGPDGPNDYSNWTFSLTPKYTVIKQGLNEITAKFFCNPNSDRASFYSMNVTGMPTAAVQSGGGGESKITLPASTTNSSNTTATVTNQTRTNG
ncbi:MAG: hypothetical protein ACJ72J_15195, partial [Nitrososphaeraceae archaeon]